MVGPGSFALYPQEARWWSFNDYRAVLDVMAELTPVTVLEFGPGSSTLALIEGGAKEVHTCEDNPDWAKVYDERLVKKYPGIVHLHRYTWSEDISVPGVDHLRFDLALIDGPFTTPKRPPAIRYAMERSNAVLVPTEDEGRAHDSFLKPILLGLASEYRWSIRLWRTGPLSGGFALLERPNLGF